MRRGQAVVKATRETRETGGNGEGEGELAGIEPAYQSLSGSACLQT